MLARILALFLILPAVELALLMYVSTLIGFGETVAIIVVTGIVGGLLAKREGVSAWNRLNRKMAGGGLPGDELVDGVIILIAGALLVTPGVLTDVVGFMGLIPPSRRMIRRYALKRFRKKADQGQMGFYMGGFGQAPEGSPYDTPPYDTPPFDGPHPANGFPETDQEAEEEADDRPSDDTSSASGGSTPDASAPTSKADRDAQSSWSGSGRRVPRHGEEFSEPGSGGDPADRV
ncbi:MAG: FxsA family protein [Bacteroidetes bacterium]|jgi:UPF0716 protein FxsA|nr:FxsA family protein [Bacteroidota bacterium]